MNEKKKDLLIKKVYMYMDWRKFLGISKPISEKELLEMELRKINETKSQILMVGYDEKFLERKDYLSVLQETIERGVKVSIILHVRNPPSKIERLANKFKNVKFHRSSNNFLLI